jgi:uracil-xanthine permease
MSVAYIEQRRALILSRRSAGSATPARLYEAPLPSPHNGADTLHVRRKRQPMNLGVRWKLHGDGRTPAPGAVVRPDERLSWPRTAGLGAQHVVAMFGASFVAPVLMGLDPNLAIMMSGVATIVFLLATRGRVPSYLGCSLSFVGVAAVIRAQGGSSATVTGAVFVVGAALFLVGLAVRRFGARIIHAAMPPIVTGAVVMLIGFNLAPVTASTYWPQDQWTALSVMLFTGLAVVCLRGFWSRIAIFLGLVFGYVLSWALDRVFGQIHSADASGEVTDHWRLDLSGVGQADWIGLPTLHGPSFEWSAILVALPVVIALIAENAGHVKAVGEMTGDNLDDKLGTAISADGVGSMLSTAVGGPPNTTYSENIGVMAATRVYSTAAYWAAAGFALLFGVCPKFGAVVAAVPGGVLGGITVILYGMIGLLGAQIWINAKVDLRNPLNLVPAAAGIIIGVGNVTMEFTDTFSLSGIALGTLVVITGYHALRVFAPAHLKTQEPLLDEGTSSYDTGGTEGDQRAKS